MAPLLIVAALLSAAPETSKADINQARELFARGQADYRNGNFQKAIGEFLAADALKHSAALPYDVAQAYDKLGDQARAAEYYELYLQRNPNARDREAVQATIVNLRARVQAAPLKTVVIVTPPGAPGASAPPAAVSPAATATGEVKPRHGHALAITLASIGLVAGGVAIVGAVETSEFQTTYNEINSGKGYAGSYTAAQSQANQAPIWGVASIALAVIAVAGVTAAAVTW